MAKRNRIRTALQKFRRQYLDKCKKEGVKPLDAKAFNKKYAHKFNVAKDENPVAKKPEAKSALKVTAKAVNVHHVKKGDVIKFVDFQPYEVMDYALRLQANVVNSILSEVFSSEKPVKKTVKAQKKRTK